jgi:hypothetical protein
MMKPSVDVIMVPPGISVLGVDIRIAVSVMKNQDMNSVIVVLRRDGLTQPV